MKYVRLYCLRMHERRGRMGAEIGIRTERIDGGISSPAIVDELERRTRVWWMGG